MKYTIWTLYYLFFVFWRKRAANPAKATNSLRLIISVKAVNCSEILIIMITRKHHTDPVNRWCAAANDLMICGVIHFFSNMLPQHFFVFLLSGDFITHCENPDISFTSHCLHSDGEIRHSHQVIKIIYISDSVLTRTLASRIRLRLVAGYTKLRIEHVCLNPMLLKWFTIILYRLVQDSWYTCS